MFLIVAEALLVWRADVDQIVVEAVVWCAIVCIVMEEVVLWRAGVVAVG